MDFKLSSRSRDNLVGVNHDLQRVVNRAIQITTVDFGVIEGVRSPERQQLLYEAGASHTLKSKHIIGKAVDLMAYIGPRASWELSLYDNIADAMKQAAIEIDIPIRWGGCWIVNDIRTWNHSMEKAMNYYIDTRREEGRRPFIDGPHFEISS
jgi:peptidoglycan L-alanyl-D-glutamate endopeptidase CwlK